MKERPILFNAEMVRAILDGRKTMTRRVVRLPHNNPLGNWEPEMLGGQGVYLDKAKTNPAPEVNCIGHTRTGDTVFCPYGKPGDRLWVRETFRCNGWATDVATIFYRANENNSYTEMCEQFPVEDKKPLPVDGKWRPSIFMPRWASRIILEVTYVRAERLQDITDEDAMSEGITETDWGTEIPKGSASLDGGKTFYPFKERQIPRRFHAGSAASPDQCLVSARWAFANLWESINGPDSWRENPWVWVVEFKQV